VPSSSNIARSALGLVASRRQEFAHITPLMPAFTARLAASSREVLDANRPHSREQASGKESA